jgi:hypothetical protein
MPRWCNWALRTLLNTIVDTLKLIVDLICIIAWNSVPVMLCSCGRDIMEMNSVPDANVKSTVSAIRQAEGKPKAQYGAFGSSTAKKRHAHSVMNVPVAVKRKKGRNWLRVFGPRESRGRKCTNNITHGTSCELELG